MASNATETCVACSKGEIAFAKGFQRTREAVENYYQNVDQQWIQCTMPPRDTTMKWKVYKLSSQKMFVHFSLFFKCESPEYQQSPGFTIELRTSAERKTVYPYTVLKSISTKDLTCLGTVTKSAEQIMSIGLECLEEFGDYDYYCNNCQNFCTKLAKKLGLEVPWTDAETTLAWGVAGAIGIGIVGAVAALWSGGKKKSEKPQRRK